MLSLSIRTEVRARYPDILLRFITYNAVKEPTEYTDTYTKKKPLKTGRILTWRIFFLNIQMQLQLKPSPYCLKSPAHDAKQVFSFMSQIGYREKDVTGKS